MIPDRKRKAIETFMADLLDSGLGDRVGRVVLFGSVARGDADPESDIDLLVFGTGELDKLSKACAVASFNTALEWGESVEPLVYCNDELRFPSSYFMYNTLRRGEEVYQMDEEMLRRREAESALALAREYLESAQNASANGFRRLAIDAAYNASELCVKGLLLLKTDDLPKSHGGVVQLFGKLYVLEGDVEREKGHALSLHLELRNKARYDFHARLIPEDEEGALNLAQEFIAMLEEWLWYRGEEGEMNLGAEAKGP